MKVKCINASNRFTKNKIYEVINNHIKDDNEELIYQDLDDIKYFNSRMSSKFELVKEEEKMFKVGDKVKE